MSKRIESIADLSPDRTNANKGTQRGRGMVEASLRETGAGRSILADKDGRIIAGNKTLEAWVDIGGEIEVVRTTGDKLVVVQREDLDLSDDTGTARKLAYYDNRAGEVGLEWDAEQLLADIGAGVDLSDLFRQDELDEILADVLPKPEPTGDAEAQVDRAEELRQKWQVETGQLWQLGEHRLICGDCTDADVVARVMGGEKADAVVTDPPYGMNAVASSGVLKERYKDIEGDANTDLAIASWQLTEQLSVPIRIFWGANYYASALPDSACWLVWDKNNGASDQMDCELAWTNCRGVTRMYTQASERGGDRAHPTQKPTGLISWCISRFCADAQVIVDWFSGSGTTIIACEQLGRKCRAVEISPAYVAVALQRWADATGKTPVLIQ